jgi:hypothetical protein
MREEREKKNCIKIMDREALLVFYMLGRTVTFSMHREPIRYLQLPFFSFLFFFFFFFFFFSFSLYVWNRIGYRKVVENALNE